MFDRKLTIDLSGVGNDIPTRLGKIRPTLTAGGYVAKNAADMTWMCSIGMQFITLLPDCTIIYHVFEEQYLEFCKVIETIKR